MAQTTDQLSAVNMQVEHSTDGTTYTAFGGFASSVERDGGDRKVGVTFTFDGDTALLTKGKREPVKLKVKVVYTEVATDPYEIVHGVYESGADFWIRYSPNGGASGDNQFTAKGIVTTDPDPATLDAESEDAIMFEFELTASSISKATIV